MNSKQGAAFGMWILAVLFFMGAIWMVRGFENPIKLQLLELKNTGLKGIAGQLLEKLDNALIQKGDAVISPVIPSSSPTVSSGSSSESKTTEQIKKEADDAIIKEATMIRKRRYFQLLLALSSICLLISGAISIDSKSYENEDLKKKDQLNFVCIVLLTLVSFILLRSSSYKIISIGLILVAMILMTASINLIPTPF
jgi:hypothetical protein